MGKISLKLFLILVLIVHWIIPVEFPFSGQGGGNFRAVLYIVLLFLIYKEKKSVHSKETKTILMLFATVFLLRFLSILYYSNEVFFPMYFIWEIVFIYILAYGIKNCQEVYICCYTMLVAILFSILWGYLIVKFGDPFQSIRYYLIGVSENTEDYGVLREGHEYRIVGFSKSIFAMGYLVAISGAIILTSLMTKKSTLKKILLYTGAVIVFIGLIGNGERSSIAAIAVVLLFAFAQKRIGFSSGFAIIIVTVICAGMIYYGYIEGEGDERHGNLIIRLTEGSEVIGEEENKNRLQRQYYGLISTFSIATPPSEVYQQLCADNLNDYSGIAPHNHFISVAQAGLFVFIAEVVALITLLRNVLNLYKHSTEKFVKQERDIVFIVVSGFLAEIVSCLFHNTGMFSAEPSAVILIGLLCSLFVLSSIGANQDNSNQLTDEANGQMEPRTDANQDNSNQLLYNQVK